MEGEFLHGKNVFDLGKSCPMEMFFDREKIIGLSFLKMKSFNQTNSSVKIINL